MAREPARHLRRSPAPSHVSARPGPRMAEPGGEAGHPTGKLEQRLNSLRAGVLGANDGIVSTAAVVVGVAGASSAAEPVVMAGLAAAIGGAVSMALGEYVSVSSQLDSERSIIEEEEQALAADPDAELDALAAWYEERGISSATSRAVAEEMFAQDPLDAVVRARHTIDTTDIPSPWRAAAASFLAFSLGAILPLAAILLPPLEWRVAVTFLATLVGLAITGTVAAAIGGGSRLRAAARVVVGGALALGATYGAGVLLDTSGVV